MFLLPTWMQLRRRAQSSVHKQSARRKSPLAYKCCRYLNKPSRKIAKQLGQSLQTSFFFNVITWLTKQLKLLQFFKISSQSLSTFSQDRSPWIESCKSKQGQASNEDLCATTSEIVGHWQNRRAGRLLHRASQAGWALATLRRTRKTNSRSDSAAVELNEVLGSK